MLGFPLIGRVLRGLIRGILPRGSRFWLQISAGPAQGFWLNVEPYLEGQYLSGYPEPCVQEKIVEYLRPGACFYDAGAHIGYYSLVASRLVGETGRVVAFEPDPANVALLQENLARNGVSNVEVIASALWNYSGVVTFRRSAPQQPEVSSRRGAVVGLTSEEPEACLIKVKALTLDSFAAGHDAPSMIKIDVEGAEVEVLQGARNLISGAATVLLFEVHHQTAAAFLQDQLCQSGYGIEWLAGHPGYAFPRHLLARPLR